MFKRNRFIIFSLAIIAFAFLIIFSLFRSRPAEEKTEDEVQIGRLIEEGEKLLEKQLYDQALSKYQESLEKSKKVGYEKGYGNSLQGIGLVHRLTGNNPLSREFYQKALDIHNKRGDSVGIAETKNALAVILTNTGDYAGALDLFMQSLGIFRRHKLPERESSILLNIGRLYKFTNDLDNALLYASQSLELKKMLDQPGGIANVLNNMGVIYRRKGEFDKALSMFEEALSIQRTLDDKTGIANSLQNIGIILHFSDKNDYAIQNFRESLAIREELGDLAGLAQGLHNLGYIAAVIENNPMAFDYYKRSIGISNQIKDNNLRLRGYEAISALYEKTGDYKNALTYFQLFKQLNDSLFNETSKNQLMEIQTRHEAQEKDLELAKTRQISIALGTLLIFALLLVLAVFYILRKRKKVNIKLDRQNKEIKRQANKIAKASELLHQNLKLKELFFAAANHELRVPLSIINGFAELLEKKIIDKNLLKYIDGIKVNSNSLQKLVNDILDLSTIESDGFRLEKMPVNVLSLAKNVDDIFSEQLKGRQINLSVSTGNDLDKWLLLDEVRVRQIIYNLMENAMKFTGKGSIILKFEISEDNEPGKSSLTIIVEDTGIGIPEECQNIVLDTSYKTKPVIKSHRIGHGLGLQIVSRLVKCMNGRIKLESSVEKGTRFEIELPGIEFSDSSFMHEPMNEFLPKIDFSGINLLIVDDSELNRMLLSMMLKEQGFKTQEAEDGADAFHAISIQKPDLILMDLYMPNFDGYKTLRKLRRNNSTRAIPVLAVTASSSEEERMNVFKAGFDAYITKPVDKNFLLNEIHQLIGKNLSIKS